MDRQFYADLLRNAAGLPETAYTIGSGLVGESVAGLEGLGELIQTGDPESAAARIEWLRNKIQHEPQGEGAKEVLGGLGRGIQWAGDKLSGLPGADSAQEEWYDATASAPLAASLLVGGMNVIDPGKGSLSSLKATRAAAKKAQASAERANLLAGKALASGKEPDKVQGSIDRAIKSQDKMEATQSAANETANVRAKQLRISKPLKEQGSTLEDPMRIAYPGVYKPTNQILEEASSLVVDESPALRELFGVTREDLARMADEPGNRPGLIPGLTANAKGTRHGYNVTNEANTSRLREVLEAAPEKAPELYTGMKGWYITEPMFQRLVELVGPEEAVLRMERFNALTSMASPSSDVVTEMRRGTAANMLAQQGRFDDFMQYGGLPLEQRSRMGLDSEMLDFPSHAYHKTAQAPAMDAYLRTGGAQLKLPKVPLYMQASLPHSIGRQSDIPVGDAHWSRAVGLPDVRGLKSITDTMTGKTKVGPNAASVSTTELAELAPWWREQVAGQAGLEAVPGQAITWGAFSPQTGVATDIGAGKLEILSDLIMEMAERERISPALARDKVLLGESQLGISQAARAAALRGK